MHAREATLSVLAPFEAYQAARVDFAQGVAGLASAGRAQQPSHEVDASEKMIAALEASDTVGANVTALLMDPAPSVQRTAMIAMGRMCGQSLALCQQLCTTENLRLTLSRVALGAAPGLLRAALFLLYTCASTSAEAARELVDLGALAPLCERVEALDPAIKTDAVWCLAAIARHGAPLAKEVVESGALPLLKLCLKEPSATLRRITLSCLGCIGQHNTDLASALVREGLLPEVLPCLRHRDAVLRRQACRALAVSAQHLDELGWFKQEATADVTACLGTGDTETSAFAAALVGQLARRSKPLSDKLHGLGAPALALATIVSAAGSCPSSLVPAALGLGHFCEASPAAAADAIERGAVATFCELLDARPLQHVGAALALALGSIAAADDESANAVAVGGGLLTMARSTLVGGRRLTSLPALSAARAGLAKGLAKCTHYPTLADLMAELPLPTQAASAPAATPGSTDAEVHSALLLALAGAFAKNGNHRLDFMRRSLLVRAQGAQNGDKKLEEALGKLNASFPGQMVKASQDPDYEQTLLRKIADK